MINGCPALFRSELETASVLLPNEMQPLTYCLLNDKTNLKEGMGKFERRPKNHSIIIIATPTKLPTSPLK